MSAAGYSESAHRKAAARLVGFAQGDRARPILRKRGPWLTTAEGRKAWDQLFELADDLLSGFITPPQYEWTLVLLAATSAMPLEDLEIIARCALEFCRCCFFGARHVPSVDIGPYQDGGRE